MVKCGLTIAANKACPIAARSMNDNVFIPKHTVPLLSSSSSHVANIYPRCANIFTYCNRATFPHKPIDMNPFAHANSSHFLVGQSSGWFEIRPLPFRSWASPFVDFSPGTDAEPSFLQPPELGPSRFQIERTLTRKAIVCLLAAWIFQGEPGCLPGWPQKCCSQRKSRGENYEAWFRKQCEVCRGCRVHGHCRKRERLGNLPNLSQLFA